MTGSIPNDNVWIDDIDFSLSLQSYSGPSHLQDAQQPQKPQGSERPQERWVSPDLQEIFSGCGIKSFRYSKFEYLNENMNFVVSF